MLNKLQFLKYRGVLCARSDTISKRVNIINSHLLPWTVGTLPSLPVIHSPMERYIFVSSALFIVHFVAFFYLYMVHLYRTPAFASHDDFRSDYLAEEGQKGSAVAHGTETIQAFHKEPAQLPGTGTILTCQHVDSIRVGWRRLPDKVATWKKRKLPDLTLPGFCMLGQLK